MVATTLSLSHASRSLVRFAPSAGAPIGDVTHVHQAAGLIESATEGEAVTFIVASGQNNVGAIRRNLQLDPSYTLGLQV